MSNQILTPEQAGWSLSAVWLKALEETARDFHGKMPKNFCMRAYEHAADNWLKILKEEFGLRAEPATTIRGAVESYIDISTKGGLFQDPSQFQITEISPNKVEIFVSSCPYQKPCSAMLREGFALNSLTCPRIGCFRAAVLHLAGLECEYEVISLEPAQHACRGVVERI